MFKIKVLVLFNVRKSNAYFIEFNDIQKMNKIRNFILYYNISFILFILFCSKIYHKKKNCDKKYLLNKSCFVSVLDKATLTISMEISIIR